MTTPLAPPAANPSDAAVSPAPVWEVQVFFDGACPLCQREIRWLRWMDARRRIDFVDLADPAFDAAALGVDMETLMARIHARLPDGGWIEGVEVFRRLYGAVGFRWLVPLTRLPGVSHLLEWGYRRFAANRLKWTGRCSEEKGCAVPPAAGPPPGAKEDSEKK